MWVNIQWYSSTGSLLREDGAYGDLPVKLDGQTRTVRTLLDLSGSNTRVYETHMAMTQEWAAQLLGLHDPGLPLSFNRETGAISLTLGQLAAQDPGTYAETFHFVLNNHVAKDNRIPPYGFSYDEAKVRNALPVPASQYGSPGPGGTYNYWDELALNPPTGASYARIRLLYQPTSWEYIQFLYQANTRSNTFLANEGVNLLNTWLNTAMAEPYVMAEAAWGTPPDPTCQVPGAPQNLTAASGKRSITLTWAAGTPAPQGGYRLYYDQSGKLFFITGVGPNVTTYKDSGLSRGAYYCYVARAWNDCNGNGTFDPGVDYESPDSVKACDYAK
jgi:hypothetical protein